MKNPIVALVLVAAVSFSTLAWSESKTFQISVTIPPHVALQTPQSGIRETAEQTTQTQQLIRDNKMTMVTSIVVP